MPHEPPLGVAERVLLPGVVDGAAGAGLAERLPLDDPHVHAVDPLDVRDLVLVALRCPLGEQIVPLGHVRVCVDNPKTFGHLKHQTCLPVSRLTA